MSVLTRRRFFLTLAGLAAATAAVIGLALLFGAEPVRWSSLSLKSFGHALRGMELGRDDAILFQLRLPRVLMAALIGAALSAAGVAFQGLLRNPLADPFILGVSGGGALGAVIAIVLGLGTIGPLPATPSSPSSARSLPCSPSSAWPAPAAAPAPRPCCSPAWSPTPSSPRSSFSSSPWPK